MRSYPLDSPEAAARIVALTMLADGHVSHTEAVRFARMRCQEALGANGIDGPCVLRELSEDLLASTSGCWSGAIEAELLRPLLAELQDSLLRQRTLALCRELAHADDHLSAAERRVLAQMAHHWSLPVQN